MWIFRQFHLSFIVSWTNLNLGRKGLRGKNASEILKFFRVLILLTRFELCSRRYLWVNESKYKYIPPPKFSAFMSLHRFESISSVIRFIHAEDAALEGGKSRWNLIKDFFSAINDYRKSCVAPSDLIFVEDSMSRWYGLGGDWIDVGLLHYVAMDLKLENGCETQDAARGRSGIMLRL